MKSTLKTLIFSLAVTLGFGTTLLCLPTFAADISCNDTSIPQEVRTAAGCDGNSDDLRGVAINIINGIIFVIGIVAVIFIIYGGIQYMTSAGDPSKTQKAKHTIMYAVIGLVIVALAYAIVNFVIHIIYNKN